MAEEEKKYSKDVLDIDKNTEHLIHTMEEQVQALAMVRKGQIADAEALKKSGAGLIKLALLYKKHAKDNKIRIKDLKEEYKLNKAHQNQINAIRIKMQGLTEVVKSGLGAWKGLASAFGDVGNKAIGLVAAFGAQKITWDGMVKTSLKYNQLLFNISRQFTSAGRGSQNFTKALQYVKKETMMSKMQFLQLADAAEKSFIGVKPDIQAVAETLKVYGEQTGYVYENAQELFAIQSEFPALYASIERGMKLVGKVNKGTATEEEKKLLSVEKERAVSLANLKGATSSQMTSYLQMLTPLTAGEKELSQLLKERQKLVKEVEDLQLDLAEKFKPIQEALLKIAIKVVEVMSEYKNVAVGVAMLSVAFGAVSTSIGIATAAAVAFNLATGGILWAAGAIVAALTGIGFGVYKWLEASSKQREESEKQANQMKIQESIQKDINGLTSIQQKEYKKLMEENKEQTKTIEGQAKAHQGVMGKIKKEGSDIALITKEYENIDKNVENYLKGLEQVSGTLKTLVSQSEDFGGRNKEASEALIEIANSEIDVIMERVRKSAEGVSKQLSNIPQLKDLNIDFTGSPDEIQAGLSEAIKLSKDLNLSEDDRQKVYALLTKAMRDVNDLSVKQGQKVKAVTDLQEINVRQQEKYTSMYESRLDSERKLMESAQFGLGASVEMMKKQVDLAYEMMETYANQDKEMQKTILDSKMLTSEELKRVQLAKTQAEAEEIIGKRYGKNSEQYKYLTQYAFKHQEITKKTMDQQQKIYDLTKDIREGYLDAIREMSTGAGEFEKIIGTQEMGVTQLMNSVKDVTGVAKLNTMALGGLQEQVLTKKGVGAGLAGKYGASGIEFMGGAAQDERNKRIYRYGEGKKEAEAAMRGEVPGRRSTVGSGGVTGVETYVSPSREAEETGEIMGEVGGKVFGEVAGKAFSRNVLGINPSVLRSGFKAVGQEDVSKIQAHPGNFNTQIRAYMGAGGEYKRGDGGFVPGVPGNKLNVPFINAGSDKNKIKNTTPAVSKDFYKELMKMEENQFYVKRDEIKYKIKIGNNAVHNLKNTKKIEDKINQLQKQNYKLIERYYGQSDGEIKSRSRLEYKKNESEISSLQKDLSKQKEKNNFDESSFKNLERDYSIVKSAENERQNIKKREKDLEEFKEKERQKKEQEVISKRRKDADEGFYRGVKQVGNLAFFGSGSGSTLDIGYKASSSKKAHELLDKELKSIEKSSGDTNKLSKRPLRGGTIDETTAAAFEYTKQVGALSGTTREARAKEIQKEFTKSQLREGLGETMEDYQKQKAIRAKLGQQQRAGLAKRSGGEMGKIATIEQQRTSAEEKEGLVASQAAQAQFMSKSAEADMQYGTGTGGGGGSGAATVRILLDKGLMAKVENADNVAVEIQNAV